MARSFLFAIAALVGLLLIAVVSISQPEMLGLDKEWLSSPFPGTVIASLIAALVGTTMTGYLARELEATKAGYALGHQKQQATFSKELAEFQAQLQADFAQLRAVTDNEAKYVMLRRSVLDAAQALLPRIREVIRQYPFYAAEQPFSPEGMDPTSPAPNKRDTTLFRLFRFFGAYRRYRRLTDWEHPVTNDPLVYYFEVKIEPILASGKYTASTGEGPVMWREAITQLGLMMLDTAQDKERPYLLDWLTFCTLVRDSNDQRGEFMRAHCRHVSAFLARPYASENHSAVRLAILGVYLYDLCVSCDASRRKPLQKQRYREEFLAHILDHTDGKNKLWLYGWSGDPAQPDLDVLRAQCGPLSPEERMAVLRSVTAAPPPRFERPEQAGVA